MTVADIASVEESWRCDVANMSVQENLKALDMNRHQWSSVSPSDCLLSSRRSLKDTNTAWTSVEWMLQTMTSLARTCRRWHSTQRLQASPWRLLDLASTSPTRAPWCSLTCIPHCLLLRQWPSCVQGRVQGPSRHSNVPRQVAKDTQLVLSCLYERVSPSLDTSVEEYKQLTPVSIA